jgi:hypothetical protein
VAGDGVRGGLVQGEQLGPDLRCELFGLHTRRDGRATGLPWPGIAIGGTPRLLWSARLRSARLGPARLGPTRLGRPGPYARRTIGAASFGTASLRTARAPGTVAFSVVSHRRKGYGHRWRQPQRRVYRRPGRRNRCHHGRQNRQRRQSRAPSRIGGRRPGSRIIFREKAAVWMFSVV